MFYFASPSRYNEFPLTVALHFFQSGLRSTRIKPAGLELIHVFDRLENFGAGVEGVHEACDCAFGHFAQEGFQLGIGLLDWVHVGAVGRQEAAHATSRREAEWFQSASATCNGACPIEGDAPAIPGLRMRRYYHSGQLRRRRTPQTPRCDPKSSGVDLITHFDSVDGEEIVMSRFLITLLCIVTSLSLGLGSSRADDQARSAERRIALVVGNSDYQHTDKLANPKSPSHKFMLDYRSFGA